jgi:hypothetical protein
VVAREKGSAFLKLAVRDLEVVLSVQHERVVRQDNVVVFERLLLQLPSHVSELTTPAAPFSCTGSSITAAA